MTDIHICAIAKNEDRYIEDWLKYHFELGFTHITIYDNNILERKGDLRRLIDNSKKLTKKMKKNVEIIDVLSQVGIQIQAYQNYHDTHKFDWCAFIDIDEYIELGAWDTINEMLNDNRFNDATAIFLAWDTISDGNIVDVPDDYVFNGKLCRDITDENEREEAASEWEKIPVYDRFRIPEYMYEPHASKMLIRGGLSNIEQDIHHYKCDNPVTKYASGNVKPFVPNYQVFTFREFEENKDYAYIRHYRTKTIREFLRQKYLNKSDIANFSARSLFVSDYFFRINRYTEAKNEYYNKHHEPISLIIITDENSYEDNRNSTSLCYICKKKKEYKNPFIVDLDFIQKHINLIDKVIVI